MPHENGTDDAQEREMAMGKRTRAAVVGLATVAMAATAFTGSAQASRNPASTSVEHQLTQNAMEAAVQAGVPGVTVEVRDAGRVWRSAVGLSDLRTGAPRGTNDRFRIGNITDTFVATVLLQMEAERKLSLDDTVAHFLPGVVRGNGNDGRDITVRELLNHTSGLYDYLADPAFDATYAEGDGFLQHRYDTLTPEQRLKVAFAHPPLFAPGTRYSFSNTNDVLAAMIIEKVGGKSYADEVRDRIIKPLGLTATSNPGDSSRLPQPSGRGYDELFASQPDRIDDVTEMNGSQGWGNSDIISSTDDLNRFFEALMSGRLLPPRQMDEMRTTVDDPDFPGSSYGLDIERLDICGTTLWYHDGGTEGWLTLVVTSEDGSHELTLNYNSSWGAATVVPILTAEFCAPTTG